MAFDIDIIELAFSIQFSSWRLELESFPYCSVYYGTLGHLQIDEGKEPRISLSIVVMFGLLLLTEGVHPNPGPISEEKLNKTFERILGGSNRAESPSLISFQKCLAQVSRDAEMTRRTPGDGMNTPPPEPKLPDGTTQNETGSACYSTADDVGVDTRPDTIRSPRVTRSDVTSVDTPVVPPEDRVYPDSDADDVDDCVIPSVSANSLNINDFIAESRLQSRTASNLNDDFYTNSERSSVVEERDETSMKAEMTIEQLSAATRDNRKSPNRTPIMRMTDEADNSDSEDEASECVFPSASGDSMDINVIYAQARAASRTAANMDDDFCSNDSTSSDDEDNDSVRTDKIGMTTENVSAETMGESDGPKRRPTPRKASKADDADCEAEDGESARPSASGDSMDITTLCAQARAASTTAANMDDDFCCNYSTSSNEEDQDDASRKADMTIEQLSAETRDNRKIPNGTPIMRMTDEADNSDSEDEASECVFPSASGDSMDINVIYAQARAASRTAANMDDDFCCNDSTSSDDEVNDSVRTDKMGLTTEKVSAETMGERDDPKRRPTPRKASKADDADCETEDGKSARPSASGDSMDITTICARARAASRTAANMDDDFCCNYSTSSNEEDQDDASRTAEMMIEKLSAQTRGNRKSPNRTPIMRMTDEADYSDSEDEASECVFPSASGDSMDINVIYAQARAASRTAANMDDDFCCNDSTYSDDEDNGSARTSMTTEKVFAETMGESDGPKRRPTPRKASKADDTDCEAEDGESARPSPSGDSMDINVICAQARAASRTADNMDDDFCCNYSTSFNEENEEDNDDASRKSEMSTEQLSAETRDNSRSPKRTPIMRMTDEADNSDSEDECNECALSSASGDSMDINVISAQVRAASRGATSMDDDFYCNASTCSDEENNDCARPDEIGMTTEKVSAETMVEREGPKGTPTPRMASKADDTDCEAADSESSRPSASGDSINTIHAQARAASRTDANMDDDFCRNDSSSSGEEDNNCARTDKICMTAGKVSAETVGESEGPKRTPTPCMACKADDADCEAEDGESVRPSASGDSMDINTVKMDDDFCCSYSTSSDGEDQDDARMQVADQTAEILSVGTSARNERPKRTDNMRITDEAEGTESEAKDDHCVLTSASSDSMDIKYIYAKARAASRTSANMDDDFYCNDSSSSDEEDNDCARIDEIGMTTEKVSAETMGESEGPKRTPTPRMASKADDTDCEAEDGESFRPSASGDSMDIKPVRVQARAASTATDKYDDFYCNDSTSSGEENTDNASGAMKKKKSVTFACSETIIREEKISKSGIDRAATPFTYSSTVNRQFAKVCDDSPMDNSHIAESNTLRKSVRFSVADRVIDGAENNERSVKSTQTHANSDKFKSLLQRVIDRSSVIPSASEAAADALKNCRTDSPFLFSHNDDVFMESDDEGENDVDSDVENEYLSTRNMSDTTSDTAEELLSTARQKDTSDIEDELAFTTSVQDDDDNTLFFLSTVIDSSLATMAKEQCLTEQLKKTPSVQDDDDNTVQAFYHTSHTDIALTGKLKEINDRANSRMRTPCALLDLLTDQGYRHVSPTLESSSDVFALDMDDTVGKEDATTFQSPRRNATDTIEYSSGVPIRSDSETDFYKNILEGTRVPLVPYAVIQSTRGPEVPHVGIRSTRVHGVPHAGKPSATYTPFIATEVQEPSRKPSSKGSPIRSPASKECVSNTPVCGSSTKLVVKPTDPSLSDNQSGKSQPTKKTNENKRKGKGSKRVKAELGTVNRLSPTSMFTAPVLGPIKSDKNNPLMADRQMSRCLTEQLEKTTSVQDDDDNTAQAFYHTSHTDIPLTGKLKEINDRANSRMRTPCALLDLLTDQGHASPTFESSSDVFVLDIEDTVRREDAGTFQSPRSQPAKKKNKKKKKGKGSKRVKEELGAVNRLSPTSMFTAPVLGPIKSDQNNPLIADRQMSRCLTEQLKKTTSVQDDDDNTLQAFYHTSHTDIALTGKLKEINDRANSRMRTPCAPFDLLSDQGHASPTFESSSDVFVLDIEDTVRREDAGTFQSPRSQPAKKKNKKKKKGKGSKIVKEELGAVKRLSPTTMFTAPVLGPIKSDQNNPLIADRQMSRCLTEQLEKTSVQDDDDNTLQAFYHTSPTDISLTGKLKQINDRANSRMRTSCSLLDLLSDQGCLTEQLEKTTSVTDGDLLQNDSQPTKKNKKEKEPKRKKEGLRPTSMLTAPVLGPIRSDQNITLTTDGQTNSQPTRKSKKEKEQKHVKEELGAVNRLSPTSMFTTPILGPIKSNPNCPPMAVIKTNSQPTKKNKKEKATKSVKDELGAVNRLSPTSMFTTPVLGPIKSNQNNPFMVNTQTNRPSGSIDNGFIATPTQVGKTSEVKTEKNILQKTVTKLRENGDELGQYLSEEDTTPVSGCLHTRSLTVAKFRAQLNRTCILLPDIDTTHKRDKQRQEKLKKFRAKMVQIKKTAGLLVGRRQEYEEKAVNDNIDNGVIVTPTSADKNDKTDGKILQKASTELRDNGDHIGQHLVEKDTIPVSVCLQTRSLTVAKFRTQLNRTCILLPEIGTTHKREKHRQEKLKEFQAKMVQINKTAALLVCRQQDSEEKAVNDNTDNGVIVTPSLANEIDRTDGKNLQKAITELRDNGDHIGQHLVEKDTIPVSECLQTRSLTVAKFRTQLNRTCVLLPEKGEKQSEKHLGYADIQSRDKHRQKKLMEFQAKIDKINKKAILLLDMQNEPKENAVDSKEAFTKSEIQHRGPDELTGFKEITSEQNQLSSGKDITETQTTFTPHVPTGPKPSFVRRRRKFRQLSLDEQQKLKLRIANNEVLVPKAPNEQKSNNSSNKVPKPTGRNFK